MSLEPALQHLDGEDLPSSANTKQDARADLKASGFWSSNRHCCAFFDVLVFHQHAQSYRATPLPNIYRSQEREKRCQYEMLIREVDRGTFTPLVFSTAGGAAPAAGAFLKRLSSLLATKRDLPYAMTISWLRCRLSFALLRASILCLRGSRATKPACLHDTVQPDLALSEGQVSVMSKLRTIKTFC